MARYLERVQRRDRRYALVHGVATDRDDYAVMRASDVTLVWSPRSNLALYGETVDVAGALEIGVRIALATDWSPSGSFNMREEIRCARRVAKGSGLALSGETLWGMATRNGAYALGLEDQFGAIRPGLPADLMLVRHAGGDPYEAVLTATDADILATWIHGRVILRAGTAGRTAEQTGMCLAGGRCADGVRRTRPGRPVGGELRRCHPGCRAGQRREPAGSLRGAGTVTIDQPRSIGPLVVLLPSGVDLLPGTWTTHCEKILGLVFMDPLGKRP